MPTDSPAKPDNPLRPALAWLSPAQADLATRIAEHAGFRFELVGCSGAGAERSGAAADLARAMDAEPTDDLRSALASSSIEIVLIGSITPDESEHTLLAPDVLRALEQRGVRIFSLAPPPGRIGDPGQGAGAGPIEMVPMLRRAPGFTAAVTALETFGPIRTVAISARCGAALGSLGARLVDAMDAALALLGEPDTIDATISAPAQTPSRPQTLLELRGDCSALLRCADGRSASVSLTDQAGPWFRGVTILGERGCLRVEDDAFEWIDPDGELIERAERSSTGMDPAGVIGRSIARRLSGIIAPEDPKSSLRAVAMAEAVALSARTGQPESPAKLLRLAGLTA